MIDMNEKEVNERIKLFLKNNTYTYIKNIYSQFYNGYIIENKKDHIIFRDDMLKDIPIFLKEIKEINYSRKVKNE